ncbi:MAG: hypothetical protein U0797_21880 [Gemmataceae bacterium]
MDETLVTAAIDLSGRPFCVWNADVRWRRSAFSSQLAEEFWRGVSSSGTLALHVVLHHGKNTHHIEASSRRRLGRRCCRGGRTRPAQHRRALYQGRAVNPHFA